MAAHPQQHVLVYGGAGALGAALIQYFTDQGWATLSVDVRINEQATHNVVVSPDASVRGQAQQVTAQVGDQLGGQPLAAVLCVAGGWAGGNVASLDGLANAELMWKQSVNSSLVAAHIASRHLADGGLLVLTGSVAAKGATGGMVGYGLAKAAVHQLTASLAGTGSGLPANARVAAILPVTLDTPGNRAAMPNADVSQWTPLAEVGAKLFAWATHAESVESGSLVSVVTQEGKTRFE